MVDPFAAALDALFNAPGSLAALYLPECDSSYPVRVIRDQHTEDLIPGSRAVPVDTNVILIRKSDAARPSGADQVQIGTFDGVTVDAPLYSIAGEPRLDVEGLTWSCELLPVG